jgi:hypothetical protein
MQESTISQYVHEAFKIGTENERNDLERRIAVIIYNLKHDSISRGDEELVNLSSFSKRTVERS